LAVEQTFKMEMSLLRLTNITLICQPDPNPLAWSHDATFLARGAGNKILKFS